LAVEKVVKAADVVKAAADEKIAVKRRNVFIVESIVWKRDTFSYLIM
jgi:hypothetical protein